MNTTTTNDAVVTSLVESWRAVNLELANAPSWKIDTQWWADRERELAHLERRLASLGVTTW